MIIWDILHAVAGGNNCSDGKEPFNWQNRNTIIRLIMIKNGTIMKQASSSSMLCIPIFLLFKLCLIYLTLVDTLHKTTLLSHFHLKHFSLLYVCDYWFASLLWCVYCTKLNGTANRFMEVDNIFVTVWHCCWCDVSCYSFLVYFTYSM